MKVRTLHLNKEVKAKTHNFIKQIKFCQSFNLKFKFSTLHLNRETKVKAKTHQGFNKVVKIYFLHTFPIIFTFSTQGLDTKFHILLLLLVSKPL